MLLDLSKEETQTVGNTTMTKPLKAVRFAGLLMLLPFPKQINMHTLAAYLLFKPPEQLVLVTVLRDQNVPAAPEAVQLQTAGQ